MNAKPGRKKGNKNISYFSHEYIITNHGDIVSFAAMIIVLGLMLKATAPIASLFIVMHHNTTVNDTNNNEVLMYTTGRKDFFAAFFYTLICIVTHAVIQEYGLDKLSRKLHLSRTKHSKFNESGQLIVFYLVSAIWGANIIYSEKYITSLSSIWENYPHYALPFWVKFYFLFQICYWLHGYPELYFQRVKKEEMPQRVLYTTLYLFAVTAAYVLNLTRLGLALLVVHYTVELLFHMSRLLYFAGKTQISTLGFMLWNFVFVLARMLNITMAYLTFYHGLEKTSRDTVSIGEGNFNTKIVSTPDDDDFRTMVWLNCLVFIFSVQAYLMWNFINFHLRRYREKSVDSNTAGTYTTNAQLQAQKRKEKKKSRRDDDDFNELTEADQNQHKELRQRKSKVK